MKKSLTAVVVCALLASGALAGEKTRKLYDSKCASCHGKDGRGNAMFTKILKVASGALDLTDKATLRKKDAALDKVTAQGEGKMPGFGKKLSSQQIAALTGYMRLLGGGTEKPDKAAQEKPSSQADSTDIAGGKKIYAAQCASCHGKDGRGSKALSRALKVELEELDLGGEGDENDAEFLSVLRKGEGKMPGYEKKYSEQDLIDIMAYVRSLTADGETEED